MVSTAGQEQLRILRILGILLATAIACISIIYFSIPIQDTQQAQFDVIMVLGFPAKDDGSITPVAKSRVLEGIRQYRAGIAPHMLMTGSAVENNFVEAQVMRDFALSQGVPASALLTEGQSRNTIQSAYYAYQIMQAHNWTSALVVSSPTHLRRASLIFSHYPLAWRMDAAPWPADVPLWKKLWFWSTEMGYTSYGRIFGFPNAGQYLPHTHFSYPRL
jgi:uncharacterized SAM-binding protein YcdF (DUF218 family)